MAHFEYLKNVVTLEYREEKCIGCGMCIEVCPHAVFRFNGTRRVEVTSRDACMECGACSRNCPTEAISVQSGVGCAAAVINTLLGRESSACCCTTADTGNPKTGGTCC